jgi:hypothetical protein
MIVRKQANLGDTFRAFHEDEEGMETLQIVMIIALAAIVLIFVHHTAWPAIRDWWDTKMNELKRG